MLSSMDDAALRSMRIGEQIEEYTEVAARLLCVNNGKDFDNAAHYAAAVSEAARKYGGFTDAERCLIGNIRDNMLRSGNYGRSTALHSLKNVDNETEDSDKLVFAISLYGLWHDIERAVKRFKEDPIQALDERRKEIEREVKETRDEIKGVLTGAGEEAMWRAFANRVNEAERDFSECVNRRGIVSGEINCGKEAVMTVIEFAEEAERIPLLNDDTRKTLRAFINGARNLNWIGMKRMIMQIVPPKYKGLFHVRF